MLSLCLLLLAAAPVQPAIKLAVRDIALPSLADGGTREPPARWQVLVVESAPEGVERALNDWLHPLQLTEAELDQVSRDPCFAQVLRWRIEHGLLSVTLVRQSCDGPYPWNGTQSLTLVLPSGARATLEDLLTPAGRAFVRREIVRHLDAARRKALADAVESEPEVSRLEKRKMRSREELTEGIDLAFKDGCHSPKRAMLPPSFTVDENGLEIRLCAFPHVLQAWTPDPLRLTWKQLAPYFSRDAR